MIAGGNILIKGAAKADMLACETIIHPFLADRTNVLPLFPNLEKVSASLCPEAKLDARGMAIYSFFFTCDTTYYFYYDSKTFSCIYREETGKYLA
jgi:hypothetical protein